MSENRYYIGAEPTKLDSDETKNKLIQRLRQYLDLRNVTVLIGNGCSIPLGAPVIHDTNRIKDELDQESYRLSDEVEQNRARALLDILVPATKTLGVEPLLAVLSGFRASAELIGLPQSLGTTVVSADDAAALERLLKKWIYRRCRALNDVADEELRHHEELMRRILLRSTTLPRCKIFTTNYDLVLERALDNLGVLYFDGFLGTLDRTLRTESYHYDLYYPGETTEGRVSRVDRVLHLYKMHGSINWRRRTTAGSDVSIRHTVPEDGEYGDVMIYPSPLKLAEMNGYPYAEMFRHFSSQIHQPQSALFTIGYSFQDAHINRLIYQALSIPSFVLIIVIPSVNAPKDPDNLAAADEIWRLVNVVNSKRILVVTGAEKDATGQYVSGAGTLQEFSSAWMPDIRELTVDANAREEARNALLPLTPPIS
jgi:SIR2-like domain